jgi:arylsulfatase A-like enzyme
MTNLVVVHTDDTGRYVEPHGYAVPTPNLSTVADEGVTFRNAHCACPTCSPSRGALMTGRSPHSNGLIGLTHRGFAMDDYDDHLVRHLGRNGYETALCGQQHEADGGTESGDPARDVLGYDRLPEDPGGDGPDVGGLDEHHGMTARDCATARAAAGYVRERAGDDGDQFFLSVGLDNTHRDFPGEHDVDPARVQPPEPVPDVPATRADMAGFVAGAGVVDACVGHVLETLRETGTLSETLFVFTTDHGPAFPFMKCDLTEGGLGVALLARFPDSYRGRTVDALVSQIDLLPTFCAYLDLPTPDGVEGHSLRPLLDGEVGRVRDAVFGEMTYHAAYEPKRSVRTDRYRYVRRFDDFDRHVLANTDDGPTKQFLLDHGLDERTRPREALYDRYHDPGECENLVDDPEYADAREDLAGRLAAWMERTDDPLLDGPVSKPAGARINVQDARQPGEERYEDPGIR